MFTISDSDTCFQVNLLCRIPGDSYVRYIPLHFPFDWLGYPYLTKTRTTNYQIPKVVPDSVYESLNSACKKLSKKLHITDINIARFFFFLRIYYVSLQNSGAVATWTKRWWRCRICNKNHSVSFTFPILFCDENTKVGTIAMSSLTKVKAAQMTRAVTSISGID